MVSLSKFIYWCQIIWAQWVMPWLMADFPVFGNYFNMIMVSLIFLFVGVYLHTLYQDNLNGMG